MSRARSPTTALASASTKAATRAPAISSAVAIDVARPCRDWSTALPGAAARCRRAAHAALAIGAPAIVAGSTPGAELSLVLGDDAMLHRLNKAWRGKDSATNVLSFPAQAVSRGRPLATPAPTVTSILTPILTGLPLPLPLGDVVLAFETIRREADEQGKTIGDHLSHLVVHGVLHLVGFDHETGVEAEEMEGLERRILAGLGIADPYATPLAMPAAVPGTAPRAREPSHG